MIEFRSFCSQLVAGSIATGGLWAAVFGVAARCGEATLHGVVVESSSGDPVGQVDVMIVVPNSLRQEWEWQAATTDALGQFQVLVPTGQRYFVQVATGLRGGRQDFAPLQVPGPVDRTKKVEFRVSSGAVLRGRLCAKVPEESGVVEVEVGPDWGGGSRRILSRPLLDYVRRAQCDGDGSFSVSGLDDRELRVVASVRGARRGALIPRPLGGVRSGQDPLVIHVAKGTQLSGHLVTDSDSETRQRHAWSVLVTWRTPSRDKCEVCGRHLGQDGAEAMLPLAARIGTVDAAGNFSVGAVPLGATFELSLADEQRAFWGRLRGVAEDGGRWAMQVLPCKSLAGVVSGANGLRVEAGVPVCAVREVDAESEHECGKEPWCTKTDQSGRFRLGGLEDGPYLVRVGAGESEYTLTEHRVDSSGFQRELSVVVGRGVGVRGVLSAGDERGAASYQIVATQGSGRYVSRVTSEGTFEIRGCGPGRIWIQVEATRELTDGRIHRVNVALGEYQVGGGDLRLRLTDE